MTMREELVEAVIEEIAMMIEGEYGVADYFLAERIIPLVAESCAQIADNPGFIAARDTEWDEGVNFSKRFISAAIRTHLAPEGDGR